MPSGGQSNQIKGEGSNSIGVATQEIRRSNEVFKDQGTSKGRGGRFGRT